MSPLLHATRFLTGVLLLLLPSTSVAVADEARPAVRYLSSPLEYQVVQRTNTAGGPIPIAGALAGPAIGKCIVEARWAQTNASGPWQVVATVLPGATLFQGVLAAPSGGWYRVDVRPRGASIEGDVTAVENVGVGEVFVIAGQSNSANHGEERQRSQTGRVAAFSGTGWQLAHDPQPGASGGGGSFIPPFGDAMVRRLNIPIGIIAAGSGGTSVREWLPRGSRFENPPTVTGNVTALPSGGWESKGSLFDALVRRMNAPGPRGFRAVLWHQGESDANQRDPSRTLAGERYTLFLTQLIRDSRQAIGWEAPWFVAQASYHTPDDPGSSDIRTAQAALRKTGVALPGPDTDALTAEWREDQGRGVHFNGRGLREHAARWEASVGPWVEQQAKSSGAGSGSAASSVRPTPGTLEISGLERFTVGGRPAFVYLPAAEKRSEPLPWIFYAPTLACCPDEAERWMQEQFLDAGVAVAGVDVGEAYGSPESHRHFAALYDELETHRGFAARPCLFGRSRGGLAVSSWAIAHPERVAGLIGVYPVFDLLSYPGLTNAAPAYGVTPAELAGRLDEWNPVARLGVLARAGIPAALIHGDVDTLVPMRANSSALVRQYEQAGAGDRVRLIVLEGQGHSMFEGFFHSQELVDFAIRQARSGARR